MKEIGFYILSGQTPLLVDEVTWMEWRATHDNHVAQDQVGNVFISTVFLGIDHNIFGGEPVLFETMIFGGGDQMWRYHTYAAAERGHARAVEGVRKAAARIKSLETE